MTNPARAQTLLRASPCDYAADDTVADLTDLRGVAVDASGYVYVADETGGTVRVLDGVTGAQVGEVACAKCAGVTFDPATGCVFVGSIDKDHVYQFEAWPSLAKVQTFGDDSDLDHPAGIAVDGDTVYVASQNSNEILAFSIASGAFLRTVVAAVPDQLEGIALSGC
jgi:DNA-binding beta-propeller fold protein YncE